MSTLSQSLAGMPNAKAIDYDEAELRISTTMGEPYLWVKGVFSGGNYEPKLVPRNYHRRPDYWAIELVKVMEHSAEGAPEGESEDGGPVVFERSIPLIGITGYKGITLIGASRSQDIEVTGESV